MVCLSRPNTFKFFKGCLPQILLSPLLNTLSDLLLLKENVRNFQKRKQQNIWYYITKKKILQKKFLIKNSFVSS